VHRRQICGTRGLSTPNIFILGLGQPWALSIVHMQNSVFLLLASKLTQSYGISCAEKWSCRTKYTQEDIQSSKLQIFKVAQKAHLKLPKSTVVWAPSQAKTLHSHTVPWAVPRLLTLTTINPNADWMPFPSPSQQRQSTESENQNNESKRKMSQTIVYFSHYIFCMFCIVWYALFTLHSV